MARRSRRAKVRHRKSKRGSEGIPMRNYRRRLARKRRKGKNPDSRIFNIISHMNSIFGRGTVVKVVPGSRTVVRRIPTSHYGGFLETRKFTIRNGKVTFLGHTRKVG